jgi:hypothetical protein
MGHERHGNGPVPTGRTGTSHETRNGAAAVPTTLTSSPCCRRVRGASCRPSGRGWPAVRAMRNLGPIRVPAYGRMGPSSVHRALEFPEQGAELQGPSRASGLWNFRWLISSRRSHTPSRLPGETPRGVHTQTDDEEECQLQQADFSQQRRCLLLLSTTGFVDLHIRRSEDQALP